MSAKYLVTGLPRTRSAWLAAVLSTPDLPCVHSRVDTFPVTYDHGLSDPSAAFMYPHEAADEFKNKPVVFIERGLDAVRPSLEKFLATWRIPPVTDEAWAVGLDNVIRFRKLTPHSLVINYADLSDSHIVKLIATHLGVRLSIAYIEHMQLLHIEQSLKRLDYLSRASVSSHLPAKSTRLTTASYTG